MPVTPSIPAEPRRAIPSGDAACCPDPAGRISLLLLAGKGAGWFVVAALLQVLAAVKMHGPQFLAEFPALSYGRVQPAATTALLYGFLSQLGFAVGLWTLTRLNQGRLALAPVVGFAAVLWNLTVLAGVVAILAGENTGFPWLEMPRGLLMVLTALAAVFAVAGLMTVAAREERELPPASWFMIGALLSFPWLLGTASWTLLFQTVRGAVQLSVNGWFIHGLTWLWFGFLAVGTLFHVVPRISRVVLFSRPSAAFAFWLIAVLAGWGGVLAGAPLPRWMTSLSGSANLLLLVPIALVVHNLWKTIAPEPADKADAVALKFARFSVQSLAAFGLLGIAFHLHERNLMLGLTLFQPGLLNVFFTGVVALALFSGLSLMLPELLGRSLSPSKASLHFWLMLVGLGFSTLPLLLGGLKQASLWADPAKTAVEVSRGLNGFIGPSTLGYLALLAAAVVLLAGLLGAAKDACMECCDVAGKKPAPANKRK